MILALALIAGVAVAVLVADRATAYLGTTSPLRARNYRGIQLPLCGIGLVVGALAGLAAVAAADIPSGPSGLALQARAMAAAMLGFGLLGLWDDVAAGAHGRGWRTHLRALRHGQATTGALKLAGGAAFAFVLSAEGDLGLWHTLLHAAVIAMSANLVNLLDLRPGRAGKFGLLLLVPFWVVAVVDGARIWVPVVVVAAAIVAFLRFDLRERAMMGDAGANAVGAVLGYVIVQTTGHWVELGALVVLAGLHLAGDKPGLSRLIEAVPPVRALDLLGRARS